MTLLHTPLLLSHALSQKTGKNIYLKYEALQPSGSFKDRGMGGLCEYYARQNVPGFVCASGGNAGLAVAYASRALKLPAIIVIPQSTPTTVIAKLKAELAEVRIEGRIWNETNEIAQALAKEKKYAFIPPFDHPVIWQNYRPIIHEIKEANVKPDAIIAAVGGGGLYSGLVQGLQEVHWNNVTMITAETIGAASFAASFQQKKLVHLDSIHTIAVTLAAKQICNEAFKLSQEHPTIPQTVTDQEAVKACLQFADDHRLLVEPACGAALAIPYLKSDVLAPFHNIVVIVCGGSGVSLALLNEWKAQFQI